ncbi:hypothetical protein B296_00013660 [Ensete ventricosum]|uniref:Uncharacterized protein n=1 Tax=Ensete ventricosum TaxID=4639 RepID=A0A427AFM7_ENSVE|nr:hypothetical protein B296_00013660 [Ensete ventricosum]
MPIASHPISRLQPTLPQPSLLPLVPTSSSTATPNTPCFLLCHNVATHSNVATASQPRPILRSRCLASLSPTFCRLQPRR